MLYEFKVIVEEDTFGYTVHCPRMDSFQIHEQTLDEAVDRAAQAIVFYVNSLSGDDRKKYLCTNELTSFECAELVNKSIVFKRKSLGLESKNFKSENETNYRFSMPEKFDNGIVTLNYSEYWFREVIESYIDFIRFCSKDVFNLALVKPSGIVLSDYYAQLMFKDKCCDAIALFVDLLDTFRRLEMNNNLPMGEESFFDSLKMFGTMAGISITKKYLRKIREKSLIPPPLPFLQNKRGKLKPVFLNSVHGKAARAIVILDKMYGYKHKEIIKILAPFIKLQENKTLRFSGGWTLKKWEALNAKTFEDDQAFKEAVNLAYSEILQELKKLSI
ncbi:MAG: hypothetical protein AB9903_34260 [Vulcanimicrobiota bacterium]